MFDHQWLTPLNMVLYYDYRKQTCALDIKAAKLFSVLRASDSTKKICKWGKPFVFGAAVPIENL